jgi:hypothetical protein
MRSIAARTSALPAGSASCPFIDDAYEFAATAARSGDTMPATKKVDATTSVVASKSVRVVRVQRE